MEKTYILCIVTLISLFNSITIGDEYTPRSEQRMIAQIKSMLQKYKYIKKSLNEAKKNLRLAIEDKETSKKIIELQQGLYEANYQTFKVQRILLAFNISELADFYYCKNFVPLIHRGLTLKNSNAIFYRGIKPTNFFNIHFIIYDLNQFLRQEGLKQWPSTEIESIVVKNTKNILQHSQLIKQINQEENIIKRRALHTGLIKQRDAALDKSSDFKNKLFYLQSVLLEEALLYQRLKVKFNLSGTLYSRCLNNFL